MNLMGPVHQTGNGTIYFRFHPSVWVRSEMMQTLKMSPLPMLSPVPYLLRTLMMFLAKTRIKLKLQRWTEPEVNAVGY